MNRPVRRPGGRTAAGHEPIGGRVPVAELKRTALESFRVGMRIGERRGGPDRYWEGYTDGMNDATGDLLDPVEPDGTGPDGTRPGEPLPPEPDDWMDLAEAVGVTFPHRCQPTGRSNRAGRRRRPA